MKIRIKILFPAIICFLTFFLLTSFREIPVSRIWNGYQVLYVMSQELDEHSILALLEKNNCKNVISRGNQRIPLLKTDFELLPPQSRDSYIFTRNAFFSDESKSAYVFYIPDGQDKNLEYSIKELSAFQNTSAGTDGSSSFPWIALIITCFFCLVTILFTKQKKIFTMSAFFLILLAYSRPLYTVAAASCLCQLGIFLLIRLLNRRDYFKTMASSIYIIALITFPVLVLFIASPLNAFFYVMSVLSAFSMIYILNSCENLKYSRYVFNPVYIRGAKTISIMERRGFRLLCVLTLVVTVIGICLFFSNRLSRFESSSARPALPAPITEGEETLPNLDDYIHWNWNVLTFPFKKIDSTKLATEPIENEVVSVTDYKDIDGKIVPTETPVYIFNNDFKQVSYESIEKLKYPALEKMLLQQGKNTSYGFTKSTGATIERFGIISLLIFILIPTVLTGYYILGRKKYGLSI